MSIYRKIEVRMWGDRKFRELSPLPPSGQSLWVVMLAGPFSGLIPGLFSAGRAAMAERLGWSQPDFDRCFAELERAGMARADWKAPLVWLPNAFAVNAPESPSVVSAWRQARVELPECNLLDEAVGELELELENQGQAWILAWNSGANIRLPGARIRKPLSDAARERDREECRFCGVAVAWNDHKGPTGGTCIKLDPLGMNVIENIVVSCRKCEREYAEDAGGMAPRTLSTPGADVARIVSAPASTPTDSSGTGTGTGTGTGEKKESCAEPRAARSPPPADPSPVVAELPLVDGSNYPVTERMVGEWAPAFPAVNIKIALARARAWLLAHPGRRKTRRGINAFIVTWLGRDQDKGGQAPPPNGRGPAPAGAAAQSAEEWLRGQGAAPHAA